MQNRQKIPTMSGATSLHLLHVTRLPPIQHFKPDHCQVGVKRDSIHSVISDKFSYCQQLSVICVDVQGKNKN